MRKTDSRLDSRIQQNYLFIYYYYLHHWKHVTYVMARYTLVATRVVVKSNISMACLHAFFVRFVSELQNGQLYVICRVNIMHKLINYHIIK